MNDKTNLLVLRCERNFPTRSVKKSVYSVMLRCVLQYHAKINAMSLALIGILGTIPQLKQDRLRFKCFQ